MSALAIKPIITPTRSTEVTSCMSEDANEISIKTAIAPRKAAMTMPQTLFSSPPVRLGKSAKAIV